MCIFGAAKPAQDNSAELARKKEEERQARITEGRTKIDEAFSRFDDPYFTGVRKTYQDYYLPDVDQQYRDARKQTTLAQARSGNLKLRRRRGGRWAILPGPIRRRGRTTRTAPWTCPTSTASRSRARGRNSRPRTKPRRIRPRLLRMRPRAPADLSRRRRRRRSAPSSPIS